MENQDQKVERVEIDGDNIRVTFLFNKNKLLDDRRLFEYSAITDMQRQISLLVTEEIMKEKKDEIVKQVLEGVNWPEIVRSEVAQRIIQEVASGRKSY